MSISSAASRLSSAASSFRAAAELPFVAATRDALPASFVVLLVAFVALLPFVPAHGPFFGPGLALRVSGALLPAFGFMGAALTSALAWMYAKRTGTPRIPALAGCVGAYFVALPPYAGPLLPYLRLVGPSGLFLALLVCGIYALVAHVLRRPWLGAFIVVAVAVGLRVEHVSLTAIIESMLAPLGRLGDTYAALMLIVLIEMLLWTVGMHGPALLAAVVTPVYLSLQMQNTNAFQAHAPLPHIVVVSLFLFVFPGGSGATLPLALMLAVSRIPKLRKIGRVALVPALFNINEPLLFGAPVVLNPYLIPPFVLTPLILATVTYLAVANGFVARAAFYVPSSLPSFVSTFLATLDWRAIVLVIINILLATAIYAPFVRAYERHLE